MYFKNAPKLVYLQIKENLVSKCVKGVILCYTEIQLLIKIRYFGINLVPLQIMLLKHLV